MTGWYTDSREAGGGSAAVRGDTRGIMAPVSDTRAVTIFGKDT
jgi:hypothetical protein